MLTALTMLTVPSTEVSGMGASQRAILTFIPIPRLTMYFSSRHTACQLKAPGDALYITYACHYMDHIVAPMPSSPLTGGGMSVDDPAAIAAYRKGLEGEHGKETRD